MNNTENKVSQTQFLYNYLRGTGKSITQSEAKDLGIKCLTARMSELRGLGLRVTSHKINNETAYKISARDIFGSRSKIAV